MAEKLSVTIYNSIKEKIENGDLDSKTFLSEAQVAAEYGVSKAPVRDALHLLTKQGYLISYHRKGYMVNSFTTDEINQIQTIRKQIEKLSVELIIKNASNEDIEALYKFVDENAKKEKLSNSRFHLELAKISGNKFMPEALESFLTKISLARVNTDLNVEPHKRLIRALLDRDLVKAMEVLDEDIAFL